ncbi:hypothetical protein KC725_00375 [Candidatus Peregrinibacteria bacterium]|nr:hypothetical protein [Candidatus Peregrinibacteria bacterium]
MKLYHCMGSCAGLSTMQGMCAAEGCDRYGHPLKEVEPCEDCSRKMADTGEVPAFCEPCKKAMAE